MIYLDSAATTLQKPPSVARRTAEAIRSLASPGRGSYPHSAAAAREVYRCRSEAAQLFDVPSPENVVFTLNATHALNLAIRSLVREGDRVLISGYEHNAVTRVLHAIPGLTILQACAPLFSPRMQLEAFRAQLTDQVRCVITTHVSNVFGYILPVEEIAQLCRERQVPLIVDASQSAGCLPVRLAGWGAAFVAMPGHKGLYGPQGTGLLLCGQSGLPLLYGGTGSASLRQSMPEVLPDRLEAGTLNVCGIAGLRAGLDFVRRRSPGAILRHEQALVRQTARGLAALPGVRVVSPRDPADQSGVLSFLVEGRDCEAVAEALARRGIAVRAGLHCAPSAHRTAGTLDTGTVRVSFSALNRREEAAELLRAMERILAG